MGGIGSGRHWYYDAKDTVEDYRTIDVRQWQREGLIKPNQDFISRWLRKGKEIASIRVETSEKFVTFMYRSRKPGKDWEEMKYRVYIEWTACNFGGMRPWFICPATGCGRRVAILYGGEIFTCRHCLQLAYPSQREKYDDRAARQADKIREKLGWLPGILNGKGWIKPKGMHQRTYQRLIAEHDRLVSVALSGFEERFGLTLAEYLGEDLDDYL